jgi:hypothetical protein
MQNQRKKHKALPQIAHQSRSLNGSSLLFNLLQQSGFLMPDFSESQRYSEVFKVSVFFPSILCCFMQDQNHY